MRRSTAWAVGMVMLAAAGFAVASIARGSSSVIAQTTTGTTAGSTTAATTPSTQTVTVTVPKTITVLKATPPAKVTICHRASANRFVTVRVSGSSVFAHFRHGDLPGSCTAAKIRQIKNNLKAKHRG